MKKIIFIITTILTMSTITANAAPVPYECVPVGTDEAAVIITENLISGILDSVLKGEGYGTASARANNAIRKAVIAGETNGYLWLWDFVNNFSKLNPRYARYVFAPRKV